MALIVRDCGRAEYGAVLSLQEDLVVRKVAGDPDDYLLLVEHDNVYTMGRGADAADLRGADERLGVPVFRVGRGGGVTFHGPGQVVAYPILSLRGGGRDVHRYVHNLEECVIRLCAEFGIAAQRSPDVVGVWGGEAKLASVGVGVRRWTTFHGVAINVSTDLAFFDEIVACRMPALRLTSMALELASEPRLAEVKSSFVRHFEAVFGFSSVRDAAGQTP